MPSNLSREGVANPPSEPLKASVVYIVIVAGILATTLCQPAVLGRLPLQNLLKNDLKIGKEGLAGFFFFIGIPWYFKPFAGILVDAFPILRTKRQGYVILSTVLAVAGWVWLAFAPRTYDSLRTVCFAINVAMMVTSTAVGAYLVEASQRLEATGRVTALRISVQSVASLLNGPLSGFLAGSAFLLAAMTPGALLLLLLPVAFVYMREPRVARSTPADTFARAGSQLGVIFRSRPLWLAALFIFLLFAAPGFSTPLYYIQNDVLKFSQQTIGNLGLLSAAGGLAAAGLYSVLCRRFALRPLLVGGVLVAAYGSVCYLLYGSFRAAAFIEAQNGFCFEMAELAVLDLAARATPRGVEGLAFSLLLSMRNLALFGTDVLGSKLVDEYGVKFNQLVFLNAGSTLVVLLLVPFLPRALTAYKDAQAPDGGSSGGGMPGGGVSGAATGGVAPTADATTGLGAIEVAGAADPSADDRR